MQAKIALSDFPKILDDLNALFKFQDAPNTKAFTKKLKQKFKERKNFDRKCTKYLNKAETIENIMNPMNYFTKSKMFLNNFVKQHLNSIVIESQDSQQLTTQTNEKSQDQYSYEQAPDNELNFQPIITLPQFKQIYIKYLKNDQNLAFSEEEQQDKEQENNNKSILLAQQKEKEEKHKRGLLQKQLKKEIEKTIKTYQSLLITNQNKDFQDSIQNVIQKLQEQLVSDSEGQIEEKQLKINQMKGLKEIFDFYACSQIKLHKKATFQDYVEEKQLLNQGKFIKFCQDFEIMGKIDSYTERKEFEKKRLLQREEVINVFKKNSFFSKIMYFDLFLSALQDLSDLIYNEKYEEFVNWHDSNQILSLKTQQEKFSKFLQDIQCHDPNFFRQKLKGFRLPFDMNPKQDIPRIPDYCLSKKYKFKPYKGKQSQIEEWKQRKEQIQQVKRKQLEKEELIRKKKIYEKATGKLLFATALQEQEQQEKLKNSQNNKKEKDQVPKIPMTKITLKPLTTIVTFKGISKMNYDLFKEKNDKLSLQQLINFDEDDELERQYPLETSATMDLKKKSIHFKDATPSKKKKTKDYINVQKDIMSDRNLQKSRNQSFFSETPKKKQKKKKVLIQNERDYFTQTPSKQKNQTNIQESPQPKIKKSLVLQNSQKQMAEEQSFRKSKSVMKSLKTIDLKSSQQQNKYNLKESLTSRNDYSSKFKKGQEEFFKKQGNPIESFKMKNNLSESISPTIGAKISPIPSKISDNKKNSQKTFNDSKGFSISKHFPNSNDKQQQIVNSTKNRAAEIQNMQQKKLALQSFSKTLELKQKNPIKNQA